MSEVVAPEVSAEIPAPEQAATAAPATEVQTPETNTEQQSKTFSQEELDAAIGKRLAREQRKWEREQQQRIDEAVQKASHKAVENVTPEQFETTEAYAEALAQRKAQEILEQRDQARIQSEVVAAYHDREEEARGKYDDFEQVAYNPRLPITDVMAQTIQSSDIGPDVAYFLGTNPKEAERISRMPPILQAKEIGRIEAKLSANPPPPKKTTNAPPPISPVTPSGSNTSSYDTTDPRSIKSMSTSDWIAADRERQRKKMEARH